MKSLQFFIVWFLFIALACSGQGKSHELTPDYLDYQALVRMIHNQDVNFYEAQRTFDFYRKDHKLDGTEPEDCSNQFRLWEYLNRNRVKPGGRLVSGDDIFKAWHRVRESDDPSSYAGLWTAIGPTTYPLSNGSPINEMGRVNVIAFHPSDTSVLYAATETGGLWKSANAGFSWTLLTTDTPTLCFSSVLVNAANPNVIWVGTGSPYGPGVGILKSVDGGGSWLVSSGGMGNTQVNNIVQQPLHPDVLLAASAGGLFKSADGGVTWTLKKTGNYTDVRFKPNDQNIAYAVDYDHLFRSADGGNTWIQVNSPFFSNIWYPKLGISHDQPGYLYLFCIVQGGTSPWVLLRSVDSGLTFSKRSDSPGILEGTCDGSLNNFFPFRCFNVDPSNANVIYTGAANVWKSVDGGVTWTIKSSYYSYIPPCAPYLHIDIDAIGVSPLNNSVWVCNDAGVSKSYNGGTTWTAASLGLGIRQNYRLGQNPFNSNSTLTGAQDDGTMLNYGSTFFKVGEGDGMECFFDYSDTTYIYYSTMNGSVFRHHQNEDCSIVLPVTGVTENGAWVTPYMLDRFNSNIMYIGCKNVWRNVNVKNPDCNALVWSKITSGETSDCSAMDQSPVNAGILYVAREGTPQSLSRTDNLQAVAPSWVPCNLPPGSGVISYLLCHPTNPDIIYAVRGGIFKSIDKGITWSNISGTLPAVGINCIVFDKISNEGLYAGTQVGVFYKNANMADWWSFSNYLPVVDVRELEIFYNETSLINARLKAATYGRGLWESDLFQGSSQMQVWPSKQIAGPLDGTRMITVSSTQFWTAVSSQEWCTVPSMGYGYGMLSAHCTANPSDLPRTATITVSQSPYSQVTVTLIQAAVVAPVSLMGSAVTGTVHMNWKMPEISAGVTSFDIYRNSIKIASIPASPMIYDDEGLPVGSFLYHIKAIYNTLESAFSAPVLVQVTSLPTIGTGVNLVEWPYRTASWSFRTQMLYTSPELLLAGIPSGGYINSVGFYIDGAYSSQLIFGFNIKVGATASTTLSDWVPGLASGYAQNYSVAGYGWQDINLSTPFLWDGTSSLLVEICSSNSIATSNSTVRATPAPGKLFHVHKDAIAGCTFTDANTGSANRPNIRLGFNVHPPSPKNLQATVSSNNVHLIWNAPSVTTGLAGYNIYRAGVKITSAPVASAMFDDNNLMNGTYYYTVTAVFNAGESLPAYPVSVTINEQLPNSQNLTNLTIRNGQSNCYNAVQVLTTGGSGALFSVKNGGLATLIAGQRISILDGSEVEEGGYFNARITTSGQYCVSPSKPLAITGISLTEAQRGNEMGEPYRETALFKLFPNPTAGDFIIEMSENAVNTPITFRIRGLFSTDEIRNVFPCGTRFTFSLQGKPNGIYLIHVIRGNINATRKIIKF